MNGLGSLPSKSEPQNALSYGMRKSRARSFLGTVGLPMPGCVVRVVDAQGKELGLGERGELLVKGPQVVPEYLRADKESASAIVDGWLHTGDIAQIEPNGYIRIVDRKKDMILVSGFNVYPNEVEDVLAAHPAIVEAAVVGVPDAATGGGRSSVRGGQRQHAECQ